MNENSTLAQFVRGFKPLDTIAYLRSRGWNKVDEEKDRFTFWTKKLDSGEEPEVLVPLDKGLRDLRIRLDELLTTLRDVEARPFEHIIEDLGMPNMDIVRTRIGIDSDMDGTLSIEDGVKAFSRMRDLMLSAACAAHYPKAAYSKRKYDAAMNYLHDARFGQTQRGSYIISVYSPVPPAPLRQQVAFDLGQEEPEPFERRTVRMLGQALYTVNDSIRAFASSGEIAHTDGVVSKGVSANLCEAIIGLSEGGGDRDVEFSFSWSAFRKAPSEIPAVQRFSADSKPYLSEISSLLREVSRSEEDVQVIGSVHRLDSGDAGSGGSVRVVGSVDGTPRAVNIQLDAERYQLAIKAHEQGRPIACVGDLVKEGRSYALQSPRDFQLLGDE